MTNSDQLSWSCSDFCIPIIQGYVGIISDKSSFYRSDYSEFNKMITPVYSLISRRSIYRTGTRFNARGVDLLGNAANSVETEQILEIIGHRFSFVQVICVYFL